MPIMAPTAHPSDDFDMAKLQKTLKQRQRHAVRNSAHVAKLTPAEIRSLNNGSLASKTGSQSSTKSTSSPARSRRSTNATPPATPDEPPAYQAQAHRNSVSRNNSVNIPTPPLTPNGHRRSSQSSTHGHHHHGHGFVHGHAGGVIHAPRPRGSVQAAFMSANGLSSRPSSSGSSTYRGLPTYRGPEVTRTGSINMLQYPSHQIVNNPLSYFSRPRQSQVSTSPELAKRESGDHSVYHAQSLRNARTNSLPNVSAPSSRQPSPPRVTDSPVSMIVDDTDKFPAFDPADDPHNQPKTQSGEEEPQVRPEALIVDNQPNVAPTLPDQKPKDVPAPASPKKEKDKQRRFTIHAALFGGDKVHESPEKKLKKTRRRTLSLPKNEDAAEPGKEDSAPAVPSGEVLAGDATAENGDFSTHPAVRPLCLTIPDGSKGKEKENGSAPVYSRCACCGRLKRPHGFNSELSPVLENENLRTNFSFEIERTSGSSGRRSSDVSRDKFIPIIPMQVGENETRQASIEPYNGPPESHPEQQQQQQQQTGEMEMEIAASSPVKQPLRQKNVSPIRLKRNSAPPGFVRFASLHGKRNGDTGPIFEEDEEVEVEDDENQPLMTDQADKEHSTVQTRDFATMSGAVAVDDRSAIDQPDLQVSSSARAVVDHFPATDAKDLQLITTDPAEAMPHENTVAAGSDTFHTPPQGTTPADEHQWPLQIVSQFGLQGSIIDQPLANPVISYQSAVREKDDASPTSVTETPTSTTTTTTVTIITPTSAATATSTATSVSTPWEQELSASYLGGADAMDLSLRPKFSFESMRSAINVTEKEKSKDQVDKATGKRKSTIPGWMSVKA